MNEGEILVDGVNIKDYTLESLRGNIGLVQQDVFLFTGTVGENILYGRPDATYEEMVDAAKKADIHEFISALPDGYQTWVGEKGVRLSGGQKQRISIARVFLKNPPILLLDEATSSLDNETEAVIQASLEELTRGRTSMVIAHRLSTIRNADIIFVLSEEGIVENGSHSELYKEAGRNIQEALRCRSSSPSRTSRIYLTDMTYDNKKKILMIAAFGRGDDGMSFATCRLREAWQAAGVPVSSVDFFDNGGSGVGVSALNKIKATFINKRPREKNR